MINTVFLCHGIRKNEQFFGHNGTYIGYNSFLTFNPKTKEIIIILLNTSDQDVFRSFYVDFVDLINSL